MQLSAVGKMYIVCTSLHNARCCLYGSATSKYFEVQPPTLQEYFLQKANIAVRTVELLTHIQHAWFILLHILNKIFVIWPLKSGDKWAGYPSVSLRIN